MSVYDRAAASLRSWDENVYQDYTTAVDKLMMRLDVLTWTSVPTTIRHFKVELAACQCDYQTLSRARLDELHSITAAKVSEDARKKLDPDTRHTLVDLYYGRELRACNIYLHRLNVFNDLLNDAVLYTAPKTASRTYETLVRDVAGFERMGDRIVDDFSAILPYDSGDGSGPKGDGYVTDSASGESSYEAEEHSEATAQSVQEHGGEQCWALSNCFLVFFSLTVISVLFSGLVRLVWRLWLLATAA